MRENKETWYYAFVRKDIAPLLPAMAAKTLEVGCGGGGTLAWLKDSGYARWTAGIELNPDAAAVARTRVDCLYEGDVDRNLGCFADESFDLVLCLDVLEHLVDPWATLQRLQRLLRPGGHLIVSLPNVRHYSVTFPLVFSGRWQYAEAGIMDRTHLRFFSHAGAIDLLSRAGLKVSAERQTYTWGSWDRWKDLATLGLLKEFWTFQYLIQACKPAPLGNTPKQEMSREAQA